MSGKGPRRQQQPLIEVKSKLICMEVIGVDWPKRSISWTSGSGSGCAADTKNTLHLVSTLNEPEDDSFYLAAPPPNTDCQFVVNLQTATPLKCQ